MTSPHPARLQIQRDLAPQNPEAYLSDERLGEDQRVLAVIPIPAREDLALEIRFPAAIT